MKKEREVYLFAIVFASLFIFLNIAMAQEVSNSLLKVNLDEKGFATKSFTITSPKDDKFSLNVVSAKGVSLSDSSLNLKQGESKKIDVSFKTTGLQPGAYVGFIEVKSSAETLNIPIIFEIESEDLLFDANLDIPPVYTSINQGEKLVYQSKIYDLTSGGGLQEGFGPVTADVEYVVYGIDGSVLIRKSEQVIVNQQAQNTNTINFPTDVKPGNYVLAATVKYKTSVGVASQTFEIKKVEQKQQTFGLDFSDYTLLIIFGIALIFFLIMILLFVFLIKDRDKILVELRKYNAEEIKNVRALLREQEIAITGRKGDEKSVKKVRKEVKQKIEVLKKKQQNRINEIRKLQETGHLSEMKKKLKEWKSRGYDTTALEYKIGGMSTEQMKKILAQWKKKYSD